MSRKIFFLANRFLKLAIKNSKNKKYQPASYQGFYVEDYQNGDLKLYGPIGDQELARKLSVWSKPNNLVDQYYYDNYPFGISYYEHDELKYFLHNPEDSSYSSVEVLNPAELKIHPSWKEFYSKTDQSESFRDFLEWVFTRPEWRL